MLLYSANKANYSQIQRKLLKNLATFASLTQALIIMKKILTLIVISLLTLTFQYTNAQEKETLVLIETNMGKIKVKLYNETPKHRDNFIKLVKDGTYTDLLFHRVIKLFMIQGGDVTSKDAPMDKHLGDGELGYTIPAEILYPRYFHKRGALCAARTSDEVNPEKESSSSQFYIVTGKFYTDHELDKMEAERVENLKKEIYSKYGATENDTLKAYGPASEKTPFTIKLDSLARLGIKEFKERFPKIHISPEQREVYKMQGGTPVLDGNYTVFGEVVDGMKTVEKISMTATNENDRPLKNIKMKMKIVEK